MKYSSFLLGFVGVSSTLSLSLGGLGLNKFFEFETEELISTVDSNLQAVSIWDLNEDVIGLHKKLIEIPSVSGGESDITGFLQGYLKSKGFTVELHVVDTELNRVNLYAYLGSKRETKVLLMSHVDTVPPFFPYKVDGDEIYGRGSVDDKASVASQIIALERLVAQDGVKEGDVALLLDIGEESGGEGASNANEYLQLPWETVIFGEPTNLDLVIGHKGSGGGVLRAIGKSGHSSIPELGINAIDLLIDALDDLRKAEFPGSDVLGKSTLNIGYISGGVAANVIPGEALAKISLRVANTDVLKIEQIFNDVLANHPRVQWDSFQLLGPVFFKHDIPGYNSSMFTGGTDALCFKGDFDSYLIGPGGFETIHGANEHINVHELVKAVDVYKDVVLYKLAN